MSALPVDCCGAVLLTICAAGAAAPATDAGWQAYGRGDYAAALKIYEQAAAAGDRLAQFNLAMMLLRGDGGRADADGGVVWLRKAAERRACRRRNTTWGFSTRAGSACRARSTAATQWWQQAAEQGHTEAQVELATQYFLGRGAPKDWKLAAKWYEAAAESGDVGAQYIMGSFYEHGDGVPQDLRKALDWYVAAARQGDTGAAAQAKDVASASQPMARRRSSSSARWRDARSAAAAGTRAPRAARRALAPSACPATTRRSSRSAWCARKASRTPGSVSRNVANSSGNTSLRPDRVPDLARHLVVAGRRRRDRAGSCSRSCTRSRRSRRTPRGRSASRRNS